MVLDRNGLVKRCAGLEMAVKLQRNRIIALQARLRSLKLQLEAISKKVEYSKDFCKGEE